MRWVLCGAGGGTGASAYFSHDEWLEFFGQLESELGDSFGHFVEEATWATGLPGAEEMSEPEPEPKPKPEPEPEPELEPDPEPVLEPVPEPVPRPPPRRDGLYFRELERARRYLFRPYAMHPCARILSHSLWFWA